LLAFASLALAAPSRPFNASLEFQQHLGRGTSCPGVEGQPGPAGTFGGTGHASHLGAVEMHSGHCLSITLDNPIYVFNGAMRLTAANGDAVLADYAGFFTLVSAGVYSFEGN
jgi:hypothetical protein